MAWCRRRKRHFCVSGSLVEGKFDQLHVRLPCLQSLSFDPAHMFREIDGNSCTEAILEVEVFEYKLLVRQPFHQLLPHRCSCAEIVLLHIAIEMDVVLPEPSLL